MMTFSKDYQPLISIVMNCYNSSRYLSEALDSVLDQTYTNWELIFWDNQSTDESAHIFKSYNHPQFKYYLSDEFTPLGEGRNRALKHCQGEWIGFLDCDDIWLNDKLEKQIQTLKQSKLDNVGLIYTRTQAFYKDTPPWELIKLYKNKPLPSGDVLEILLLKTNFIPLVSALVHSKYLKKILPIPKSFFQSEDYYLFAGISSLSKVEVVQDVCCRYRIHENNLSHSQLDLSCSESIKIIQRWGEHLDEIQKDIRVKELETVKGVLHIKSGSFFEGLLYVARYGSIYHLIKLTVRYLNEKLTKSNEKQFY